MEFVGAHTLQDELRSSGRLGWQQVISIGIDVCQALRYAHDRGIIHRNVSLAKLIRTQDGHVKLLGFGIVLDGSDLTDHGSTLGNVNCMAPEHAAGGAVTNRTDLYGLGVVLFTLLAGRPPFTGIPESIYKSLVDEPPTVRSFAPDVSAELDELIAQLLKKNPQDRIPTALVSEKRLKALQHAVSDDEPEGNNE